MFLSSTTGACEIELSPQGARSIDVCGGLFKIDEDKIISWKLVERVFHNQSPVQDPVINVHTTLSISYSAKYMCMSDDAW
jgi:hypothetical protein